MDVFVGRGVRDRVMRHTTGSNVNGGGLYKNKINYLMYIGRQWNLPSTYSHRTTDDIGIVSFVTDRGLSVSCLYINDCQLTFPTIFWSSFYFGPQYGTLRYIGAVVKVLEYRKDL